MAGCRPQREWQPCPFSLACYGPRGPLSWFCSLPAAYHSRQSIFLTFLTFYNFQYIFSFTLWALPTTPEAFLARILTWLPNCLTSQAFLLYWVELSWSPDSSIVHSCKTSTMWIMLTEAWSVSPFQSDPLGPQLWWPHSTRMTEHSKMNPRENNNNKKTFLGTPVWTGCPHGFYIKQSF